MAEIAGTGENRRLERIPPSYRPEEIAFVDGVVRRAGLNPRHYRIAPLVRRVPACLRVLKIESLSEARHEIETSPERLLQALNALLIGTTAFFRDRAVFEELDRHLLAALRRCDSPLRVWSAACSDGAELYSVAMMLDRHGSESAFLLGTDCRASALARAREGSYPLAATDEIPAEFAGKYFQFSDTTIRVSDSIRARVRWDESDLMTEPAPLRWDLILCRNLAIYLEPEPMLQLWKKLSAAIVPGGYLVVGRAEKPPLDGFSCVAPCLYRKNLLPSIS